MPKIRKRVIADLGTLQGVVVHSGKGGATPQVGLRVGYKFSYIFQLHTTKTCAFLLLFFSNFISSTNVPTSPSIQHHVFVC
jgi:hypothetical protein